MTRIAYRIRDWDAHFENHRTREIKRLTHVLIPTKMDGSGYTELMDHPDGSAHYGCWISIASIAAKCDPRGLLVRDRDIPLTAATLARMSRHSPDVMRAAIDRLLSESIGWLEAVDLDTGEVVATSAERRGKSREPAAPSRARASLNLTKLNLTEEDSSEPRQVATAEPTDPPAVDTERSPDGQHEASESGDASAAEVLLVLPCVGRGPQEFRLTRGKIAEYQESFPGLDVLAECRKALQWIRDNPLKRKTHRGMPAFVCRWLSTANDSRRSRASPPADSGKSCVDALAAVHKCLGYRSRAGPEQVAEIDAAFAAKHPDVLQIVAAMGGWRKLSEGNPDHWRPHFMRLWSEQ
jgi:hypothetical protein